MTIEKEMKIIENNSTLFHFLRDRDKYYLFDETSQKATELKTIPAHVLGDLKIIAEQTLFLCKKCSGEIIGSGAKNQEELDKNTKILVKKFNELFLETYNNCRSKEYIQRDGFIDMMKQYLHAIIDPDTLEKLKGEIYDS